MNFLLSAIMQSSLNEIETCNNFCYLLLRTHHNWLYVLKRTSTKAAHLKMRTQCIHNIDFDFHYFQFHFIVCKVKHKIENRREKREKNVKREKKKKFIFHLTISTLMLPIFCVFILLLMCNWSECKTRW